MTRAPVIAAAVVFALASTAIAAEKLAVRLGEIDISYDPARWRVAEVKDPTLGVDQAADGVMLRYFFCIAPDCYGHPFVTATARLLPGVEPGQGMPQSGPAPALADINPLRNVRPIDGLPAAGADFGGLHLAGQRTFSSACRARTPASLAASGVHGRYAYSFRSGGSFGCGGIVGVPPEMLLELLSGISVVTGE